MERKFCGKCGKPIAECICEKEVPKFGVTDFSAKHSEAEAINRSSNYYTERFDNIALAQGEVVVRQYHIGEFSKRKFGITGKGNASVIITNKRVINKQDSSAAGTSSTSVEELNLENVQGVSNLYSQGYTIWRLALAVLLLASGVPMFITSLFRLQLISIVFALFYLAVGIYMALTCKKPSYLFSVYASTSTKALTTGANLRGKMFGSAGYGIVFQYTPTKDAIRMMCEMGACIMDLKNKGDYAIETWKQN